MPGFWPDEKQDQSNSLPQDDQKVPPPGAASAKYRAMEGIETAIEHQLAAADNTKPGPEKEALEKAVADLMRQLETMRMEADEEYARELGGS
jgi:collagen type V/XI/XXIV/XXVII alpha